MTDSPSILQTPDDAVGGDTSPSYELPLTAAQLGIWLGQRLDPDSAKYNAAECVELSGKVDVGALENAIGTCVAEADALRVRIVGSDEEPRQRIVPNQDATIEHVHVDGEADPVASAFAWMRADMRKPLNLRDGPVSRHAIVTAGSRCFWYHVAHHIVLDGFGFALVAKRVAALYTAAVAGREPTPASFRPLGELLEEEWAYRSSNALRSDGAFWRERLEACGAPPGLNERTAPATADVIRHSDALPVSLKRELSSLTRPLGATWVEAVIAAVAGFLARETARREVVLGVPMMGRQSAASLRTPSMLMNIVPLRIAVQRSASFVDWLERVRAEMEAVRPHARYRYEELRRDLKRLGAGKRLFGPVVNVMPFDHGFRFAGRYAPAHNLAAGPVEDLAVGVSTHADGRAPRLDFDANAHCYRETEVRALLERFVDFLQTAVADPERPLGGTARVAAGRSLVEGEPLERPARDVLDRIGAHADERAARTAVEDASASLSYAELWREAGRLAATLREHGARPESLVAIALPRSPDAVVAMVGTWMAGAAYLPLDPDGPAERNAAILEDARPALLIGDAASSRALAERYGIPRIAHVRKKTGSPCRVDVPGRALAYVIYTSGSTGRPNGVMIERRALSWFVEAALKRYGWHADDRVLQFAPLHFDASVEEIVGALCAGATLVLRDDAMLESTTRFMAACEARRISVLDLPTAFWHELAFTLETQQLRVPPALRMVIIGGEAAAPERVRRWRTSVGASVQLLNTYGPTEATVVATSAALRDESLSPNQPVPIGTPLPGVKAAVVAEDGVLADVGEVGELCLMGPTLARGYLERPRLQARRFVQLEALPEAPRAYRTGDRVRLQADGRLVFLGRVDDEIKISGHRIDPREVEDVLLRHPLVREAAVVPRALDGLGKRLVAHVATATGELEVDELRRHAAAMLPGPAMPARFVATRRLPRTASGKVDHASLRATTIPDASAHGRRPSSPLERTLLAIWEQVLGQSDLSVDDDFFERGGQSLQTIQVATRLGAHLGRDVPVSLLFDHPTIAEAAAALEQEASQCHSDLRVEEAMRADAVLPSWIRPAEPAARPPAQRRVLLTGATGFVGAHVLAELLETDVEHVVCPVRAADHGAARARLRGALERFELRGTELDARVTTLAADLTKPRLGLSEASYAELARTCATVLHCAAGVSLVRGYTSLRAANVLATRELLLFTATDAPKAMHHVSTLAAALGAEGRMTLPERFVTSPPVLKDGYARSKWVAEQLLRQAAERGIPVAVYRLGRIVGPADSALVNAEDIVWRIVRAGVSAGLLPDLDVQEPWTPADFVARLLVRSAQASAPRGEVYNVAPSAPIRIGDVFDWVEAYGYPVDRCALPEWLRQMKDRSDAADTATLAFFDRRDAGEATAATPSEISCERTRRMLAAHGLEHPSIDHELVHRYLGFCERKGWLPPPRASRGVAKETGI